MTIAAAFALGGSSAAIAGATGAFVDSTRTFTFTGAKNGIWTLSCPFKSGHYAKPKAEKDGQKFSCLYETDDNPETQIRLEGSDNDVVLECTKTTRPTYSCDPKGKRFTLEKEVDLQKKEEYLKVTIETGSG
ncbi:hypothetical protein MHLP_01840 [Candidatus Mycoplasma haematolamae str. Purdue]|uniref:Uncharacterized protein n=1 Tax=Mycoplasma haematolamae (strain Purdue) TaxID=1212765 RepID=I7BJE3_MYCHA|nr:hypothetical protein [Candidatus Mycoplasma haematolamae]AFO51948.1 hypothetical protein MHLP_01840 [Candidatus Mycoplasma haematolamae str. Purdue]